MSKNIFFDEKKWREAVSVHDWYCIIYPEFESILTQFEGAGSVARKAARDAVYGYFESLLGSGEVVLGTEGKDWDAERKPIDTIVIHHTKGEGGITWQRLSVMHLLRLYAKSYLAPSTEKEIEGMPVYSHHFRKEGENTIMVFYSYHWLVREDGTAERLLNDSEIGWQAGDWNINCRSIGICLDGDFEHSAPPIAMIEGVKKIIRESYPQVDKTLIIPHREANPKTTCPGEWFSQVTWI